ncbi:MULTISPECIES: DUF998 domain-containing protein [Kordiimonas]|uniref:DUF998 domain-containing protein n=1 Tax=Kordiimonas TaxID=288021 RepID=UPI00257E287E|nr:DUF998 domain-containing protein [Kordiimonas sp. UBA4487]
MKHSATFYGVMAAAIAMLVAPFFMAGDYSNIHNAVSELGAQNTSNSWVMNLGFVLFGIGVGVDASMRLKSAPIVGAAFLIYGIAMVLVGIFSHKPIDPLLPYDAFEDDLHSLFATVVGTTFSVGTLSQAFCERAMARRTACVAAALSAVILPLCMLQFPDVQGVPQRFMFVISFFWLVGFLPEKPPGKTNL